MKPIGRIIILTFLLQSPAYSFITGGGDKRPVEEECLAADWLRDRIRVCFTCDTGTSIGSWPDGNPFATLVLGSCHAPVYEHHRLQWDASSDIIDRRCVVSEPVSHPSAYQQQQQHDAFLCSNNGEESLHLPTYDLRFSLVISMYLIQIVSHPGGNYVNKHYIRR